MTTIEESGSTERSSITLQRWKDYFSWHIRIVFDGEDEAAVLDRIAAINALLTADYAPQDVAP